MCQWLPLPNSEFQVCFACMSFQSHAGVLAVKKPVNVMRVGDEFVPVTEDVSAEGKTLLLSSLLLAEAISNNSDTLTSLYHSWLGKQMLEELVNEQE